MPSIFAPRIIAYQYEGDRYCVACTQARFGAEAILEARLGPDGPTDNADTFGVPNDALDNEGETLTRIYDTDDWWDGAAADGQHYAELSCGNYFTYDQRLAGEMPRSHVTTIAEWENPDFDACDCGDGCPADDCSSCEDRRYRDDDDDPDYVRMSGCDCAPCLAGDAYVTGSDDAQYDAEFVAQSLIPPFTGRRASRVESSGDVPGEPDELIEATPTLPVTPGARYTITGIQNGWEDDSEDYGGTGPACRGPRDPSSRGYLCERIDGHPGRHGAFGSAGRRLISQTVVWR